MNFKLSSQSVWLTTFANDNDPFIPEVWAAESLMILFENVVVAGLVHRDFSDEIAAFGDVVNTRRPAKFTSKRKVDDDSVTTQDATSANVAVKLDCHEHVSFVIKDGEESKGFKLLREVYLEPAVEAIAKGIEENLLGTRFEFHQNATKGAIGSLGIALTKADVIQAGEQLTVQLAPQSGRNFVVSPATHGDLLNIADFTTADKIGDDGTTMRSGSLGERFGLRTHMSQNCRTIANSATNKQTFAINLTAGYAAGTTVMTTDGTITDTILPGDFVTIAGDDRPQQITAVTGTTSPTSITVYPGLKTAVANDAVITHYGKGPLVDETADYAAGYAKDLVIDTAGAAMVVGNMMVFGNGSTAVYYGSRSTPTTTALGLNRPLEAAVLDNAVIGFGPDGNYNWAFHRNAVALVSRPLAAPASGTGALSAVVNMDGIGMRVTITYDGSAQGHRVTVDLLCGVKVLDTNLGVLVYG